MSQDEKIISKSITDIQNILCKLTVLQQIAVLDLMKYGLLKDAYTKDIEELIW